MADYTMDERTLDVGYGYTLNGPLYLQARCGLMPEINIFSAFPDKGC